jgi:catechol 2,3-dioxygenase-like lactoylglutathione lyase family enzyme
MAFVDDLQRAELLSKALDALGNTDGNRSHELYRDIVQTLTRLCNKNQKEIANELSQLAKGIEEQGKSGESFEFKQRTCAVMLELSMEDRRRAKVDGLDNQQSAAAANASSAANSAAAAAPAATIPPPSISSPSHSATIPPTSTHTTSNTIPPTPAPMQNTAGETKPSQSFDPASTEFFTSRATTPPSPTRMIGVSTQDMEPITIGGSHATDSSADSMRVQSSATSIDTALPFLSVEYLYMGSKDYDKDLTYYSDVLGAQEVWKFDRFGSRITAFSLSAGPLLLLADHREGPSCQPVFRVSDLASCARELSARGWKPAAGPFGTPNGEAYSFEDPSGNRFAILQIDETSTDRAYFDPTEGE